MSAQLGNKEITTDDESRPQFFENLLFLASSHCLAASFASLGFQHLADLTVASFSSSSSYRPLCSALVSSGLFKCSFSKVGRDTVVCRE